MQWITKYAFVRFYRRICDALQSLNINKFSQKLKRYIKLSKLQKTKYKYIKKKYDKKDVKKKNIYKYLNNRRCGTKVKLKLPLYTKSEKTIKDDDINIGDYNDMGYHVWPSSIALSSLLSLISTTLSNFTIIEIGCGLALPSYTLLKTVPKSVKIILVDKYSVLKDTKKLYSKYNPILYNIEDIYQSMCNTTDSNIINKLSTEISYETNLTLIGLDWKNTNHIITFNWYIKNILNSTIQCIQGADIFYLDTHIAPLFQQLALLRKPILLVYENRNIDIRNRMDIELQHFNAKYIDIPLSIESSLGKILCTKNLHLFSSQCTLPIESFKILQIILHFILHNVLYKTSLLSFKKHKITSLSYTNILELDTFTEHDLHLLCILFPYRLWIVDKSLQNVEKFLN